MEKHYAKQIIQWAEDAKETLTIRKEIIIDENITDEKLGNIIRMMYRAKERAQNETIKKTKENAGL
jgi:DNA-binding protein H-NS